MPSAPLDRRRWAPVALPVALLAVIMIGVASAARTASDSSTPTQSAPTGTPHPATAADVPGVVHHQDPDLGVELDYPNSWRVASSPEDALVLETGRFDDLVLIRKTTLRAKVDATNVADFRTVTDGILGDPHADLDMLDTGPMRIGRLPGIFYVYTFPFRSGRGMQAQYFVFKGRDLYTLVFQTGRANRFAALAPSFDAVLATFSPTGA